MPVVLVGREVDGRLEDLQLVGLPLLRVELLHLLPATARQFDRLDASAVDVIKTFFIRHRRFGIIS